MLSVSEALSTVLREAKPLPAEKRDLALALGGVLAEAVTSDIDSPPFTKALMDGFALREADCRTIPATLRIIEEVAAGKVPTRTVQAGEATRIMTGAPIPAGADSVVMVERTEAVSLTEVRVIVAVKPGQNILTRGSEMVAGDVVMPAGAVLGPQDLGLLAAVGRTSVYVSARPRVSILTTGDEIVEPPIMPGPGQIRNTNGPMLLGQSQRAGGLPRYLGIARDNVESLRSLIATGLSSSEVLILSGGVSAGKFDLVPGVLQELGVVSHFHRIVMKPGKPLFFGTSCEKLVFGLPGNPVSSFVCFELFIRPALRKMGGHAEPGYRTISLPLSTDFRTANDRPTFWPARIDARETGFTVQALPWQGSADLRALHTVNALLALPPGAIDWHTADLAPVIALE
ncbi:MAG: molybdopterin molybdotransferase MoeA [Planctomycetes bacterium]|nr:molybdopterin molybdotransferase MoeA [Planctomycetota bacterium]